MSSEPPPPPAANPPPDAAFGPTPPAPAPSEPPPSAQAAPSASTSPGAPPAGPSAPPPPPPGPSFDAAAQTRSLVSLLDPTGIRPTAIVAGVILALFFGAQLVNALIPNPTVQAPPGGPVTGPGQPNQTLPPVGFPSDDPGPRPGGSTLDVGPLRIPLEGGWQAQDGPNSSIQVRLTKATAAIDIIRINITSGNPSPSAVYDFYIGEIGSGTQGFASSPASSIQVGGGLPAARGTYTGIFGNSQVEGEVTALVAPDGSAWIFDAWGAAGTLRALLPEAERMVDNVQVR